MEHYLRYAIYYTPEPGPFADFMAAWLGWDPVAGQGRAHPDLAGLPAPVATLTETPRRYGFHATLKPPFRLADGSGPDRLRADFDALAAPLAPARCAGLHLSRLGGFLALVAQGGTVAIDRVAASCVADLDRHRAPATDAETARRRAAGLTPRQATLLAAWGYPFVMDAFRFHLTLTGRLAPASLAAVEAALGPALAPLLPRPFELDAISLMGEDGDGRFHLIRRAALTG